MDQIEEKFEEIDALCTSLDITNKEIEEIGTLNGDWSNKI